MRQALTISTSKPVLIFGSGRSGTTWVQDVLAEANAYGTIFEPLHPDAVIEARELANLYVRTEMPNPELRRFMENVFEGRLNSVWASLRVRPDRLLPSAKVLFSLQGAALTKSFWLSAARRWIRTRRYSGRPKVIKFIRANLMIEWLSREFGFPSALIVRHPCAVLASVCRRGGPEWNREVMKELLHRYLVQPQLVEDRLADKMPALLQLESMAGIHAAIWCIENAAYLDNYVNPRIFVSYYEHLTTRAEGAWSELTQSLGLTKEPCEQLLERPSQQARFDIGEVAKIDDQIYSWRYFLTDDQLRDVQAVLDLFTVTRYSVSDANPIRQITDQNSHVLHAALSQGD